MPITPGLARADARPAPKMLGFGMVGRANVATPRSVAMAGRKVQPPITFGIIIATFNRAGLLQRAIASALDQDRPADEVWVVDDGSTDGTARVLAAYGDAVSVIHADHRGPGAARNRAIAQAAATYLVFLDDDDRLLPWALATYEDAIGEHGRPAVVMSAPFRFAEDDELREVVREPVSWASWPDFLASASARKPVTICAAIRRDAVERAGGFVEHVVGSEDMDLFLRLGTAPGYVYVDAPHVYAYRQAGDSMTRDARRLHGGVRHLLAADRRGAYGWDRRTELSVVLARNVMFAASRLFAAGAPSGAVDLLARGMPHLRRAGQIGEAVQVGRRAARRWLRSVSGRGEKTA